MRFTMAMTITMEKAEYDHRVVIDLNSERMTDLLATTKQCVRVCVCMCVCKLVCMCACVCMCVCV